MKYIYSILKNSVLEFQRNKVQTFLTSLGITIGVFSVVMLISIGLGLKNYLEQTFEDIGSNLLFIFPGQGFENGIGQGFSSIASSIRFDERDLRELKRMQNAEIVVPGFITRTNLESDTENENGSLQGVSEEYGELLGLELVAGEFFGPSDVSSRAKVAVIGESMANKLFDQAGNALGQYLKAGDLRVKVIGVAEDIGDPEQDNGIMIPYTTTYNYFNPDKEFLSLYIRAKGTSEEDVKTAINEAERILSRRYEDDEFSVVEPSSILASVNQIFSVVNAILIAIGSISLIVGGVGIMNIMYANVTERTQEIGIRRSIGATKSDILIQFVAESTLLSLLGGLVGLLLATALVAFVRNWFPLEINSVAIMLAIGISSIVGVFFGSFPARSAANLEPIDAIRYE